MQTIALARGNAAAGPAIAQRRTQPACHAFGLGHVFGADDVAKVLAHQVAHLGSNQFTFAVAFRFALAIAGVRRGRGSGAAGFLALCISGRMYALSAGGREGWHDLCPDASGVHPIAVEKRVKRVHVAFAPGTDRF